MDAELDPELGSQWEQVGLSISVSIARIWLCIAASMLGRAGGAGHLAACMSIYKYVDI